MAVVKKLLDIFCGAGGASMGYNQAGFIVQGIDIHLQKNYPFPFVRTSFDCISLDYLREFDVIHASPPCQRYSKLTKTRYPERALEHPDLVAIVRDLLQRSGVAYIIENVIGSPLNNPTVLCGSMFGLEVRRHRLFETNFPLMTPPSCNHTGYAVGVYGHTGNGANSSRARDRGVSNLLADWRRAMGIEWMNRDELAQAIPPAYTKWIGEQFLRG